MDLTLHFPLNAPGLSYLPSLKWRKIVWLRFAESFAKGPGFVPVAPATLKQLSDATNSVLPLWCLPAGLRKRPLYRLGCRLPPSRGHSKTKPNLNLGLDLRRENTSLPSPMFDIHCCIILCDKGCRRQSLWGQRWVGTSCTGKGVNCTKREREGEKENLTSPLSLSEMKCPVCTWIEGKLPLISPAAALTCKLKWCISTYLQVVASTEFKWEPDWPHMALTHTHTNGKSDLDTGCKGGKARVQYYTLTRSVADSPA